MKRMEWAFINSGKCSPSFNMALDEALLNWHSEGKIPPVLRFYEWNPPTMSVGYFQKVSRDINLEEIERQGIGLVRRPTGGRGVLHDQELTYSVIVSEDHPDMPETVTEAYRVISGGLLEGFRNLGLDASFSVPDSSEAAEELRRPKSGVCFDAPSWYELVVEGKKIAGSAQTRQQGVILQHGAILLHLDIEQLTSLFQFSSDRLKERVLRSLPERAVAIDQLTDRTITIEQCIPAFKDGFEKALAMELVPYELSEEQLEEVRRIEREKYANDEWTFHR